MTHSRGKERIILYLQVFAVHEGPYFHRYIPAWKRLCLKKSNINKIQYTHEFTISKYKITNLITQKFSNICIKTGGSVLLISDSKFAIIYKTQQCWQLFSILYSDCILWKSNLIDSELLSFLSTLDQWISTGVDSLPAPREYLL